LNAASEPEPIRAKRVLGPALASSFAAPYPYEAEDGHGEWAVKFPKPNQLRALMADQVIGRVGHLIEAAVGDTQRSRSRRRSSPPTVTRAGLESASPPESSADVSDSAFYYSLIQVVPDPVRGERMNVGVVAWDPARGVGTAKFTRSRVRLKALGLDDLGFLSEFESWLLASVPAPKRRRAGTRLADEQWSLEAMEVAAREWGGMIQLTPPRPSLGGTVEELAQEIYDRAVFVHKAAVDPDSGRQAIRQSAAQIVRHSIRELGAAAPLEVAVSSRVEGRLYPHVFDVVVSNGNAKGVLITPNFADKRTEQVRRDLDAAAWAVHDVQQKDNGSSPAFGILTAPTVRPAFSDQLAAIVDALRVAPLQRNDLSRWATQDVLELAHHG
jgi:DUF3037 family protein